MTELVTLHLGSRQPKRYCQPHEKPKFPADLTVDEVRDLMFPKDSPTHDAAGNEIVAGSGIRQGYGWEGDPDEHAKLRTLWDNGDFLHEEQPGIVKCRVKIRLSKDSTFEQSLAELSRCWQRLDHKDAPVWVSGTDPFWVQMVSKMYGGIAVREWNPAEGDE